MKVNIQRALISVSDKTNLDLLVNELHVRGVEIISTGGTAKKLKELNVPYTPIESVTGNPEAFGGRMKTISFQILSSLLFRRENADDCKQAEGLGIKPIDLVVCNLYPFAEVLKNKGRFEELVENIDIGGPTMIRAAAKNMNSVTVLSDPAKYVDFVSHFKDNNGATTLDFRKKCAVGVFQTMAAYDSLISKTMESEINGVSQSQYLRKDLNTQLRYGENSHQKAWIAHQDGGDLSLLTAEQLQGKTLSYNNYLDADAALRCCVDLGEINLGFDYAVSVVKHSNSCGQALAASNIEALKLAWEGDPISSFGSIICFNSLVDADVANWLSSRFVEVILAPDFSEAALAIFGKKKNLRLLKLPIAYDKNQVMIRTVSGGYLLQEEDSVLDQEFQAVTKNKIDINDLQLARFGTVACKHLKSNAIGLVKKLENGFALIGGGMGNPNRLISLAQAVDKARDNGHNDLSDAMLISDAFFPFRDNIDLANKEGIKAIIQPGGSVKDDEVVAACDEFNIKMAFTGRRHFRH